MSLFITLTNLNNTPTSEALRGSNIVSNPLFVTLSPHPLPQESVGTSTMEKPTPEQEVNRPGLERATIAESAPLIAGDGEVTILDAPFADSVMDISAPAEDDTSVPIQVEDRSCVYVVDRLLSEVAGAEPVEEPIAVAVVVSASAPAVDRYGRVFTEEPIVAVTGGSVDEPEAVDLIEGPQILAAPNTSAEEPVAAVPVEAPAAVVEGGGVESTAEIATGGHPVYR